MCLDKIKPGKDSTFTLHVRTYIHTHLDKSVPYLKGDIREVALFQCHHPICNIREVDCRRVEYGAVVYQVGFVPADNIVANPLPTGQEAHVEEGVAGMVAVGARDAVAEVLVDDLAVGRGMCYVGDEDV